MSSVLVKDDIYYMQEALKQANLAFDIDEVPIGAIIVCRDKIVARAHNLSMRLNDFTAHAEMQAIRSATHLAQDPSLAGCTIYASGHPCPMCLAAIVMTGMERVFFAFDNVDAAPYGLSSEGTYQRLRLSLDPSPLPIARVETGVSAAQLYGDAPWSL